MLFATIGQGAVFLVMLGAGLAIGVLTLLSEALRRILQAGRALSLAVDLAAGLLAAAVLIAALIFADYGRIRIYQLLGAALGLALFRFALTSPARGAAYCVRKALRRLGMGLKSRKVIIYLLK